MGAAGEGPWLYLLDICAFLVGFFWGVGCLFWFVEREFLWIALILLTRLALNLRDLPASAPQGLRLKVCAATVCIFVRYVSVSVLFCDRACHVVQAHPELTMYTRLAWNLLCRQAGFSPVASFLLLIPRAAFIAVYHYAQVLSFGISVAFY